MPKPECPPLFLSGEQKGELCQYFYKPKNVCPRFGHKSDRPMDCIPCFPIDSKPICYDPLPKGLPPKAVFSPNPQAHGHSKHKTADGAKPMKFETMCCPKPCLPCVPAKYLVPCMPCPEPSAIPCPQPAISCPVPLVVPCPVQPAKGQCPMVCFMPEKKKKVPEYVYQATVTTPKKVANRYISSDSDHYCFMHCEKKTPRKEQCQYYLVKAQDAGGKAHGPSSRGSGHSLPASCPLCIPCLPSERPRAARPPCPPPSQPMLPCCAASPSTTPHDLPPTAFCYIFRQT